MGSSKPAGWYKDPSGKFDWRWFDGVWTDDVSNDGDENTYTDPVPRAESAARAADGQDLPTVSGQALAGPVPTPSPPEPPAPPPSGAPDHDRSAGDQPPRNEPRPTTSAWWKRRVVKVPVWLWAVFAVVLIVGIAVSAQGDDDPSDATSTDPTPGTTVAVGPGATADAPAATAVPTQPPAPADGELGIGDTDTTGDLSVTLHAFEDPVTQTDGLTTAAAGNEFVAVELTLTNTSAETQTFSTLLLVDLIDEQNQSWDVSIFGTSDRPSLDGDIPPGESRRGWIAFEVPTASSGFRLQVKGNLTASGITFTLS